MLKFIFVFLLLFSEAFPVNSVDGDFQELMKKSVASSLFGATMGLALISFTEEPMTHLNFIAMGASVGFILGSVIWSYILFYPTFERYQELPQRSSSPPSQRFYILPVVHKKGLAVEGVKLTWSMVL